MPVRKSPDRYDLIVIGGGPAGTTLATLVKKHAPGRKVLLLEKAEGPRHHVGESLLPGLVPVLKEMGVFEKIDGAGFPRKLGANYIWGRDREVWENDFNDVNISEMLARHGSLPDKIEYSWQVRRSVYDEILLRHAEDSGVEVRRGAHASSIVEEGARVTGVVVEESQSKTEYACEFLADCSGQSGFLSKFRRIREYNSQLKNFASYAYFKGAQWKYRFSGHPDKTKIFVCSVDSGWFWFIPISSDTVSVGHVTSVDYLKKNRLEPKTLYFSELKKCPEIWPLLKDAKQIEDFDGTGRDFFTESDWSYLNIAAAGPGWLAAGDAAVFVDPILSSGVTLAHLSAQRAAYTLLTHWEKSDDALREMLWADYNVFCRESAAQFLVLALFWYGNDRHAESWWGRAKEIQKAWLPVALADQTAFITVSAGLTRHYERGISAAALIEEGATRPKDYPFYVSVLKRDSGADDLSSQTPLGQDRPRLLYPYETEIVFLPVEGKPLLQPVKRVRFLKHDSREPLSDALNPRQVVTRHHLDWLKKMDGLKTIEQISAEAAEGGAPRWWVEGRALDFMKELRIQGVLDFTVEALA